MPVARVHAVDVSAIENPRSIDTTSTVGVLPYVKYSKPRDHSSRIFPPRILPRDSGIATARSPTPPLQDSASSPTPARSGRCYCVEGVASHGYAAFRRLHELWEPLQVSHCGKYSIERMMALDEYCRSTPKWRVAVVCTLTPLPAVLIVVLMEIPPLSPPDAGCLANYVFWLRHWFAVSVILLTGILQCKQWIPELPLSHLRMVVMSFVCSGIYVSLNILVGYLWAFPIPFLAVLGGGVMFPIWVAGIVLAVGYRRLLNIPDISNQLKRFLDMQGAQSILMVLYPANYAAFLAVPSAFQAVYMAVLPAINLAMKNMIASKGSHLEDRLPETVVFSVEVFSALYSVFCMRSSNTLSSVSIMMAIDVVVVALSVHGMHQRTLFTQELILETTPNPTGPPRRNAIATDLVAQTKATSKPTTRVLPLGLKALNTAILSQMLSKALELLQQPGMLDSEDLRAIRLLSGTQHKLSPANSAVLSALERRAIYDNTRTTTTLATFSQTKAEYATKSTRRVSLRREISGESPKSMARQRIASAIRKSGAVVPGPRIDAHDAAASPPVQQESQLVTQPPPLLQNRRTTIMDALQMMRKKNTVAVHEVLQLLFSSEYLVLIAYVPCIIPPMYLLYSLALRRLPNAAYYPRAAELQSESELQHHVSSIAFYWGLELLLLLGVHVLLRRVFSLTAMYQVAFVLESHALLVQCKLIFTLIFAVQSTVSHYGADYSFAFEWLRQPSLDSIDGSGSG